MPQPCIGRSRKQKAHLEAINTNTTYNPNSPVKPKKPTHEEVLQQQLHASIENSKDLYTKLRVERHKVQRCLTSKAKLQGQIDFLNSISLPNAQDSAARAIKLLDQSQSEKAGLKNNLAHLLSKCAQDGDEWEKKQTVLQAKYRAVQKENKILKQRSDRMPQVMGKAVQKAIDQTKRENHTHRLVKKGVYDQRARALARLLVKAGCAQSWVGKIIHAVLEMAGIECPDEMSRRTVKRAILEGGMLADMQIGHRLAKIRGMICFAIIINYYKLI
jgi:hypothetical protein